MSSEGGAQHKIEDFEDVADEDALREAIQDVKSLGGLANALEKLGKIPHSDGALHDTSRQVEGIRSFLEDTHDGSKYSGSLVEILEMFGRTERRRYTRTGGLQAKFDECVQNEIDAIKQTVGQDDTTTHS